MAEGNFNYLPVTEDWLLYMMYMLIRSWMELKRNLKMQNKQILVQFAAKAAVCEQKLPKNTADNLDLIHDKTNLPVRRENKYIKLV